MKYTEEYLKNMIFGNLKVLSVFKIKNRRYCHCLCDCGTEKDISLSNLLYRRTISCGCEQRKISKKVNTKHGLHSHPLYSIWSDIVKRCENKKCKHYKEYGQRGISVCKEWRSNPESFIKWAECNGWEKGLTIDRINVNGNYDMNNCRFVNRHIQSINQRIRNDNSSGYKGIKWNKVNKKWQSYINVNKKHIYLGEYQDKAEALQARNDYIIQNNLNEYEIQK